MSNALSAVSKMSGEARQYTRDEVLGIIDSITAIVQSNDKDECIKQIGNLRGVVNDGHYDVVTVIYEMNKQSAQTLFNK